MRSKHVIAACVDPFDTKKKGVAPINVLATSFYAVIHKAFGGRDLLEVLKTVDCTLFVEGPKNAVVAGGVTIFRLPIEMIDEVAEKFIADSKDIDTEDIFSNKELMIFVIGSSVFCQDVVRFAGMDRKGKIESSCDEFMERIMSAASGEVVWTDTMADTPFFTGDLVDLFVEAKRAGVIPG